MGDANVMGKSIILNSSSGNHSYETNAIELSITDIVAIHAEVLVIRTHR